MSAPNNLHHQFGFHFDRTTRDAKEMISNNILRIVNIRYEKPGVNSDMFPNTKLAKNFVILISVHLVSIQTQGANHTGMKICWSTFNIFLKYHESLIKTIILDFTFLVGLVSFVKNIISMITQCFVKVGVVVFVKLSGQ
jgi:hypothetical protein